MTGSIDDHRLSRLWMTINRSIFPFLCLVGVGRLLRKNEKPLRPMIFVIGMKR
jgi:hypothetical protein